VSASVNLPLHHEVQKSSSGTGSSGWSWKKGRKTVVVWWWWASSTAVEMLVPLVWPPPRQCPVQSWPWAARCLPTSWSVPVEDPAAPVASPTPTTTHQPLLAGYRCSKKTSGNMSLSRPDGVHQSNNQRVMSRKQWALRCVNIFISWHVTTTKSLVCYSFYDNFENNLQTYSVINWWKIIAFSALTLLVWTQEEHPAFEDLST